MNKTMFWSGFSIMAVEALAVVVYLMTTLSYSWLKGINVTAVIGFTVVGMLNIAAVALMIIGAFSKGESNDKPSY